MSQAERSLRSSERVEPEEYSRRVSDTLGDAAGGVEVSRNHIVVSVSRDKVVEVLSTLKSEASLACDYFTCLSAVDWQDEGFEVLIMVYSMAHLNTVILKVRLDKADAKMPSSTGVYRGANWHERECFEMFGIEFEGHPRLEKLYLPPDFEGHPLLKSFKLASRTYKPWPGAKDPGESGGR